MKRSLSEKEFLKQFFGNPVNSSIIRMFMVLIVVIAIFAWVDSGRPAITFHLVILYSYGWFMIFTFLPPLFLVSRWRYWTESKTSVEKEGKAKLFWFDQYNILLCHHALGYLAVSLVLSIIATVVLFGQWVAPVIIHMCSLALVLAFMKYSHDQNMVSRFGQFVRWME